MKRYYIFKDGMMIGSTATRENASDMIRSYQKAETHPLLKSEFSIIFGEEEIIPYESTRKIRQCTIEDYER